MIKARRIPRERLAAALTLVLAAVLVTYAATSTLAAAESARPATPPATPKVSAVAVKPVVAADATELLVSTTTTNPPVKGDARAADEPPSRPAVAPAKRKLSATSVKPRTRTIRMEVTAYCACRECCGPNAKGITASGRPVTYNRGKFVAADTSLLPFGTKLIIPGYNNSRAVPVLDRGGAIEGRRLDLFFPSHQQALQWGRQMVDVTVVED